MRIRYSFGLVPTAVLIIGVSVSAQTLLPPPPAPRSPEQQARVDRASELASSYFSGVLAKKTPAAFDVNVNIRQMNAFQRPIEAQSINEIEFRRLFLGCKATGFSDMSRAILIQQKPPFTDPVFEPWLGVITEEWIDTSRAGRVRQFDWRGFVVKWSCESDGSEFERHTEFQVVKDRVDNIRVVLRFPTYRGGSH